MKRRLRALLVHGMGSSASWWDPLLPFLRELGIEPYPLTMPSLEAQGPDAWLAHSLAHAGQADELILLGHSLGAGVCIELARLLPLRALVLLACPSFHQDFSPPAPPDCGLSLTAVSRVARFLRRACQHAGELRVENIHFVGSNDPWVSIEAARRLPFPLEIVPGAGHRLNRSARFAAMLKRRLSQTQVGRERLDPAVRLLAAGPEPWGSFSALELEEEAPAPSRIDIEVTTACQLHCPSCARTLYRSGKDAFMQPELFASVLSQCPFAHQVFFVGLGEPMMHPDLPTMLAFCRQRELQTVLVTNGLLAVPETLNRLRDAGLNEVTFSIDSADATFYGKMRPRADLPLVLRNFRAVPEGLQKSIFATLTASNVQGLISLIDLAADSGLPALGVTDVNFPENRRHSLANSNAKPILDRAIAHARTRGVLLLGPHLHELVDFRRQYRAARVSEPRDLTARTGTHAHCLAPWRILVLGADGTVNPCDCSPQVSAGSLNESTVQMLWNAAPLRKWRRSVLNGSSSHCRVCPRY